MQTTLPGGKRNTSKVSQLEVTLHSEQGCMHVVVFLLPSPFARGRFQTSLLADLHTLADFSHGPGHLDPTEGTAPLLHLNFLHKHSALGEQASLSLWRQLGAGHC